MDKETVQMISNRELNLKLESIFVSRKSALFIMIVFLVLVDSSLVFSFPTFSQQQDFSTDNEFSTELKFSQCFPTCQTKWCHIYAKILKSTMDLSVNPCDDFYSHVCANWNPSLSHLSYLALQLENIHEITQFALEDRNISSSKLVHYMTELYQDWVHVPKRAQLDLEALLGQLLGHTQLTLFTNSSHSNVTDYRNEINSSSDFAKMWDSWKSTDVELWMDCFVEASLVGVDTLFKHIKITDKKINILFNEVYALKNYFRYSEFLRLKTKIPLFFKIDKTHFDSSLNYVLFEMIDFKLELGKIYTKSKTVRGEEIEYSLTDFLEGTNSSTNFNWTLLFSKFANKTGTSTQFLVDADVKVITQHLDLLTAITELISSTPIRVLKNLMAIDYFDLLQNLQKSKKLSNALREDRRSLLWREFVDKNFELLLPIYTRLFVDYVGWERLNVARDQANEMMQNMKRTFGESLKHEYTWLDEQTRVKALEKVNAMRAMISHPDWILDDTALDKEFGFDYDGQNFSLQPIKGNFAVSYLKLLRIIQSGNFRKLDRNGSKPNERKFNFTFDAIGTNWRESNLITITHALLLDPSFNVDYPIGLNYGHLGTTISHELIHGFDSNGRMHGKHGEEINWWTDYATEQFENRSQCFVRQYEQVGLNGKFILGENIADNGGLNLAYRLFEKHLNHSKFHCNSSSMALPPFLAKYSQEQLFFLAYGLDNCLHPNYSSNSYPLDPHSPEKYRVNIPLQNFVKFSQAFNCPVGSKMNPEKKCLLW